MKPPVRLIGRMRFAPVDIVVAVVAVFFTMAAPISVLAAEDAASAPRQQPGTNELADTTNPATVGYLETVIVNPGNMRIDAKIDTGAKTSSIHTINILTYEQGGQQRARFTVLADGNVRRRFDLPVLRVSVIKRANSPPQRRFVVEMEICLGGTYKKAEVNLINRKGMKYRMLIGRAYIAGQFIVDPKAAFLTRPNCKTP